MRDRDAEREIERIEVRRKKLVESIMDGVPAREVRDELTVNAARREELKAKLAAADGPPPLLHLEWPEPSEGHSTGSGLGASRNPHGSL